MYWDIDLRDGIQACDTTQDNSIIVRDADDCVWKTQIMTTGWPLDCTAVQSCMASTIATINTQITNINATLINHETRITNLEWDTHSHANKSVLDWIRDDLSPQSYLGGDWNYHTMSLLYTSWHIIRSNWINYPQRWYLEFIGTHFQVQDDPSTNSTIISLNPAVVWWGGSTTDDYVISAVFNTSNILTLTRNLGGVMNVDLSSLAVDEYVDTATYDPILHILTLWRNIGADLTVDLSTLSDTDELVKVWSTGTARYLGLNDFLDNWTEIEIRKQMSITSDTSWLMLVNDAASPGANMIYGTDGTGLKWWVPNTWNEVSITLTWHTWLYVFNHGLGKRPNIVCEESTNWNRVFPGIRTIDANNTELTFSTAFTGTVYAN